MVVDGWLGALVCEWSKTVLSVFIQGLPELGPTSNSLFGPCQNWKQDPKCPPLL